MMSSPATLRLTVNLTRDEIGAGPHAHENDPVTRDMESLLYDYYGSDPYWGASHFGGVRLAGYGIADRRGSGAAQRRRSDPAA